MHALGFEEAAGGSPCCILLWHWCDRSVISGVVVITRHAVCLLGCIAHKAEHANEMLQMFSAQI